RPRWHRLRLRWRRRGNGLDGCQRVSQRHCGAAQARLQRFRHRQAVGWQPDARLAGGRRRRGQWVRCPVRHLPQAAIALLMGLSCASTAGAAETSPARLDEIAQATVDRYHLPGLAIGVIEDGEEEIARGYGEADADDDEAEDTH